MANVPDALAPSAIVPNSLEALAAEVLDLAVSRGFNIVVAESLTGGLLASTIVSVPGASRAFCGGVVAYSNQAKQNLLGVAAVDLAEYGAVSSQVAGAMAAGVRHGFPSDGLISASTTGVAGPDSQDGQPVGRVFIGVCGTDGADTRSFDFEGDRQQIREQAVFAALGLLRDEIQRHAGL